MHKWLRKYSCRDHKMKACTSQKSICTALEVWPKNVSFSVHLGYKQLKAEVYKGDDSKSAFIIFALLTHSKN